MRFMLFGFLAGAALLLAPTSSAVAEPYESWLARLKAICASDCLAPRPLLRAVRFGDREQDSHVAAVLPIGFVGRWNGKFLLVAGRGPSAFNKIGQRAPLTYRPVTGPDEIVVEMEPDVFFDLLNVPVPGTVQQGEAYVDENGDIVVARDRMRYFSKPTLRKLRSMFRDRVIVVRGQPRLEVAFDGAVRDRRRKKLFIELTRAEDIVSLPRFDKNGEAIVDGEFEFDVPPRIGEPAAP